MLESEFDKMTAEHNKGAAMLNKHAKKVVSIHRIEFSDFMALTMSELGKTWDEVEKDLPSFVYEGDFHMGADGQGNSEGDIFKPLCKLITLLKLDVVILYHDN